MENNKKTLDKAAGCYVDCDFVAFLDLFYSSKINCCDEWAANNLKKVVLSKSKMISELMDVCDLSHNPPAVVEHLLLSYAFVLCGDKENAYEQFKKGINII